MKALLITALCLTILLAGCTWKTSNDTFPPCNAQAPPHYTAIVSMTGDSSDASVIAQSAQLQGWTNVVMRHPVFDNDSVSGDCAKAGQA